MLEQLCSPALLYIVFSITQIIIDIFKGMYNTAFFKFMVMILFTILLNALCMRGLGIISWFIVFVPFISMTIITTMLLLTFGLSPDKGSINYKNTSSSPTVITTSTNKKNNQPVSTMPPTAAEVNNYNNTFGK